MFDHGVEYDKELAHAGCESQLLGLPLGEQVPVGISNDGVVPGSHQSSHVERRSYDSSSAPDCALPSITTAVPVEGSYTHQRGYSSAVQCAQFRKISQQGSGKHGANSR